MLKIHTNCVIANFTSDTFLTNRYRYASGVKKMYYFIFAKIENNIMELFIIQDTYTY